MKDSEFMELLNLYLDHEISAADAARLEAAVQDNPSRRRLYQDYCRMQKACKLLAQDFATAPEVDRKVIAFAPSTASRSGARRTFFVAGSFAAAAAIALAVFVRQRDTSVTSPAENLVVQTAPAIPSSAPAEAAPVQLVAAQQPAAGLPARTNEALSLRHNPQGQGLVLKASANTDARLTWMQEMSFAPVQLPTPPEQLQLELSRAVRSENQNRTYTSGNRPVPQDVPWVAIRFQR